MPSRWYLVWILRLKGSMKTVTRSKNYFQHFKKPGENTTLITVRLLQQLKGQVFGLWQEFYCLYVVCCLSLYLVYSSCLMMLSDMLIRIFDLGLLMLSDLKKREGSLIDKGFQNTRANVIQIKLVVKNLGMTNIGNTNLVVLNNYHQFPDSNLN